MSSLNLVVILAQCRCTKIGQRIFKYSDIQYTTVTVDKKLNSLIYRTLLYVNVYLSYRLILIFLAHHVQWPIADILGDFTFWIIVLVFHSVKILIW